MTRRFKRLIFRSLLAKTLLMLLALLMAPHDIQEPLTSTVSVAQNPVTVAEKLPEADRQPSIDKGQIWSLEWSPDGRFLAAGTTYGWILFFNASGQEIAALHPSEDFPQVAWRPDSQVLAVAEGTVIRYYSAGTWREARSMPRIAASPECLAWSSDGRWLAEDSGLNRIRVWNAATGRLVRRIRFRSFAKGSEGGECHCEADLAKRALAWRPGTRQLAYAGVDSRFRVWDASTGRLLRRRVASRAKASGVAWSRDGARLAVGSESGGVTIWDAATGKRRQVLCREGEGYGIKAVSWRPATSTCLAAAGYGSSNGSPIRLFDTRAGKRFKGLGTPGSEISVIAWSPDGKTLASCGYDREVQLWSNAKNP